MKMHKDRLTERQRLFCEMYVGPGRHCAALAARLAGYAPGCSHVTGCQLLKQEKIAATVRGLEDVLAREIRVSRQKVIAELVGAAEMAKLMMDPGRIVSALRQIALMSGYYRQEEAARVKQTDGQSEVQANILAMTDTELLAVCARDCPQEQQTARTTNPCPPAT